MRAISTPLTTLLGLRVPIIQAPMAGGPSTPELVAAVSGAGALGSLAFAYTQPEDMRRAAAAVRERTDRPFAIAATLRRGRGWRVWARERVITAPATAALRTGRSRDQL